MNSGSPPAIDWSVAVTPYPGQQVCGDLHVVETFPDGILLAVMDGLGHGYGAAEASRLAAESLRNASSLRLSALVGDCHEALRGSRGVVLTLAVYRPWMGTLEWAGIGNVEGVVWRRPGRADGERLCVVPRGGVVGYQMPRLHVSTLAVEPGDLCCLATDGIASSFVEKTAPEEDPRRLAQHILARHCRGTDDALVLAVRFGGPLEKAAGEEP